MRLRGFAVIVSFSLLASNLFPCAGAFKPGQQADIYNETALITWNPDTKVENFIRKAWFRGQGADFGFLIPTPTEPTLSESSDAVYGTLYGIDHKRRPPSNSGGFSGGMPGGRSGGAGGAVEVIKEQSVAGYKATVLRSDNAMALNDWLDRNGYPASSQIQDWATPYTRSGFYITALKIERQAGYDQVGTSSVRITFRTPQPFYPYREPKYNRRYKGQRQLRLYFVGPQIVDATYGNTRETWQAQQFKIKDLTADEIVRIEKDAKLPEGTIPEKSQMTTFTDRTVVRPDIDLLYWPEK